MLRDLGDFQTPLPLVEEVLHSLQRNGKSWSRVLEPTCRQGNFIKGILDLETKPVEIQGIEIQSHYAKEALDIPRSDGIELLIHHENIFQLELSQDLRWRNPASPLLVIGNPPWITNAELGTLGSTNLPGKKNLKKLSGFDAMTGSSNFDIAEYIWLKLIWELADEKPTIALLCKTSVARNILQFAFDTKLPISTASIRKIDSKKYFGAMVDACLFSIEIDPQKSSYQAEVYENLRATTPNTTIGIVNGQLRTNVKTVSLLADGICPLNWRQGVKHDAASVMELAYDIRGNLKNKLGEIVDIETEYVYPLRKSSDLGGEEKVRPERAVIVTQKYIGENTLHLQQKAPQLWKYLTDHANLFTQRKSTIYQRQPPFSIFGIGEYSFSHYKVAISGMYKQPKFRAVGPINNRPVMFDDTCYFISCISAQQAALLASLLNDPLCIAFIHSIVFWDAKRPVTKKLLQRIDLPALLNLIDQKQLLERATLELKRMAHEDSDKNAMWPENLAPLLLANFINNDVINTSQEFTTQMTLL